MNKSVGLVSLCLVLSLSGCNLGPSDFEQARMDDCLELYYASPPTGWEQDPVRNPVKSIQYKANGPDTGTVSGGIKDIEFVGDEAIYVFQCSVSGLEVKMDYARSVFE